MKNGKTLHWHNTCHRGTEANADCALSHVVVRGLQHMPTALFRITLRVALRLPNAFNSITPHAAIGIRTRMHQSAYLQNFGSNFG